MANENQNQQQAQQQQEQAASPKTVEQNAPVTGEGAPDIDSVDTSLQSNDTPTVWDNLVAQEAQKTASVREGETVLLRVVKTREEDAYQMVLGYRQRDNSPLAVGYAGDQRFGSGLTMHWLGVKGAEGLKRYGVDLSKLEFVDSKPLSEDAESKETAFCFMKNPKHVETGRKLAVRVMEFTEDELLEKLDSLMTEGGYSIDEIAHDKDIEEVTQELRAYAWEIDQRERRAKRSGNGKMYACSKREDGTFQAIYRFTAVGWESQELENKLVETDVTKLTLPEMRVAQTADVMEEEAATE